VIRFVIIYILRSSYLEVKTTTKEIEVIDKNEIIEK
jgi:hypothetical protein